MAFFFTSCLEGGLEELDTYTGNDITSIQGVYYRYIGSETIPGSGEQTVHQVTMSVSDTQIDTEAATVDITVTAPSNFPESELGNLSASELVVIVNLSAAAIIEPINGAPTLGAPGDWSKPNQYRVTAASGDEKVWTITLTLQR